MILMAKINSSKKKKSSINSKTKPKSISKTKSSLSSKNNNNYMPNHYTKITRRKKKKIPIGFLVILASIIVLIIGIFTIGTIKSIVFIFILNLLYFIPASIKKGKSMDPVLRKKRRKKRIKILLLLMISGIILMIIALVAFWMYISSHAPNFDPEALFVTEPSILYDKDGNVIGKLGTEKRVIVSYDDLPEVLIDAIVATEDSKFFVHNGVDWKRFLKASVQQVMGHDVSGASTLTMQISKNAYTSKEASGIKGIIRKFTDVYISTSKIEPKYSKEEIFEFYVNSYFLGSNSYGVEQASLTYFGKSAKDLNLAEAAMIAGLFQAPGKYNPYTNPEATEKRRQTVLYLMKRHGYITDTEYKIAKEMTVDKIVKKKENQNAGDDENEKYQVFIDMVVDEIEEKTDKNPYTTSMEIYTTMDASKQDYLNDITNGNTYEWENDVVQTGIAVTDVKTGAIVAISGGRNYVALGTNRATDLKNQIGSTAKPLYDYGPAIEYLNWSTYNLIVDEPISYSDGTSINNWDGQFKGMMTAREALAQSRNIPALKAFQSNNKDNILNFVKGLGLSPESPLHEAHSIGGYNGENPLSMSAAYAAFGNNGYYTKPYSFTKIIYKDSGEEFVNTPEKTQAMSEETAYMISDMLITTSTQALGGYSNINGVKFAAKTGTTNFDDKKKEALGLTNTNAINDYWVVGYNTDYSIAVWYGYDKSSSEYYNKLSSAQHSRLFQAVGKGFFTSNEGFSKPDGVVQVEVETECPEPTLPSEYTPSEFRKTELFIRGTEPTEVSKRFAKLNDVSNLKATSTGNTVTISWDAVNTPEINTENYLRTYYKNIFRNDGSLGHYISSRMSYINNNMGAIGYNVYRKEANGTLTSLGFTESTNFTTTITSSDTYTFVVKTSYSIFKNNMSDGKTVSVKATVSQQPTTDDKKDKPKDTDSNDTQKPKDDDKTNEENNTTNNNKPIMGEVTYEP